VGIVIQYEAEEGMLRYQLDRRLADPNCEAEVEACTNNTGSYCHAKAKGARWSSNLVEVCWRKRGHEGSHVCGRNFDGEGMRIWLRWYEEW
jgi:hypothetical protein